jgi:hypothetical protein
MGDQLIQFGNVFRHNEKEYVFLAQADVVYAALILDRATTEKVNELSNRREMQNSVGKHHPAYAIVILETAEFAGRGAHFARTDQADHQITAFDVIGSLNRGDCSKIKEEIVSKDSVVPIKLIEIVKELRL